MPGGARCNESSTRWPFLRAVERSPQMWKKALTLASERHEVVILGLT
jgi:hypothetical protein